MDVGGEIHDPAEVLQGQPRRDHVERVDPRLGRCHEGRVKIRLAAHRERLEFHAQSGSRPLGFREFIVRVIWIPQEAHARYAGSRLFQNFQPLGREFVEQEC